MPKRPRPAFLLAALSALALVLGSTACAGVQGLGEFKAAAYLPQESWLVTSLTLRPSAAQMLHVKSIQDAYSAQPGFDEAWASLRAASVKSSGVDFEKEILPLIEGEVAVGVYGMLPESQPRWLALMRSNSAEKLLVTLPFDPPGTSAAPVEKGYKGASFRTAKSGRLVGAAYKGWTLLSEGRVPLEQTIDRIDTGGKGGLAETSRYKTILERLPADRLAYAYLDLSPSLLSSFADLSGPRTAMSLEKAQGRLATSLTAVPGGIESRVEWVPELPGSPLAGFAQGNATPALHQLPSSTLAAYAGGSLPFVVNEGLLSYYGLAQTAGSDVGIPEEITSQTEQLLGLLGGEFAAGFGRDTIAVMAGQRELAADAQFVARLSDVDGALALLEAVAGMASPDTVQRLDDTYWFGTTAENWAPVTFGVEGDLLLVAGGLPEEVFARRSALGLGGNARFQMVQSAIQPNTYDASFADLQTLREVIEEFAGEAAGEEYAKTIRPFLVPLRAVAGSTVLDDSGATHSVALLAIRK